jgi:expansin
VPRLFLRRAATLGVALLIVVGAGCAPVTSIQIGPSYAGQATHYRLDGLGNCSYPEFPGPGGPLFAALNEPDYDTARLCGAHVEVTGPGGRTVTVRIVDRCPGDECVPAERPHGIDLSRDAFTRLADPSDGVIDVTWRVVPSPSPGFVGYRIDPSSSAWWLAIQPLNHRWPVERLEIRVDGEWRPLARQMHNYFVAPSGLGPGPFTVRLTDIRGESLVHEGIVVRGGVQTTASQFSS